MASAEKISRKSDTGNGKDQCWPDFDTEFTKLLQPDNPVAVSLRAFLRRTLGAFRLLGFYSEMEVLSEVYIRGHRLIHDQCTTIDNPSAWVRKTAHNVIREWSRKGQHSIPLDYEVIDDREENLSYRLALEEEVAILYKVRQSLTKEEQRLLTLRIDKNLSWREIAGIYAEEGNPITESALRQQKTRILKHLRRIYHALRPLTDFESNQSAESYKEQPMIVPNEPESTLVDHDVRRTDRMRRVYAMEPEPMNPIDSSDQTLRSGRLPFRTDPETHGKIALAAQQAGKSINAWMEEVLSREANDRLGYSSSEEKITSGNIRDLFENPEALVSLIDVLAKFLKDDDPYTLLRFGSALKKMLIGLDAILPFLQRDGESIVWTDLVSGSGREESVYRLATIMAPLLQGNNPSHTLQLWKALKKFMVGLDSVKPFLIEDETKTSVSFIKAIFMKLA
jgi:DNA-directed RNA polymerase specialized sigma24 family protein